MEGFTKKLLNEYKKEYKSYENYLSSTSWVESVQEDLKGKITSDVLGTEVAIIDSTLKSLEVLKKDVEEYLSTKTVKDLFKLANKLVDAHCKRMDEFRVNNPINKETDPSLAVFITDLFRRKATVQAKLGKIVEGVLTTENTKSIKLFYEDKKAPLVMREFLCKISPDIKTRTDNLGINFGGGSINPVTSNQMLINMKEKDIPYWDPSKHYFEQSKDAIQFWEEEIRKCKEGITINGYWVHPYLYWHLNIFKLTFGAGIHKRSSNPHFRDNEYFFAEMLQEAEKNGRVGLFMYGSRRISKSVNMASYLQRIMKIVPYAKGNLISFSKNPDLIALHNYINESELNIAPAFKVNINNADIDKGIWFGLRKTAQTRLDYSELLITNLEGGSKQGSQKTAGGTPDAFAMDEVGKGDCIAPWTAAMPSFADSTGDKWRCVPLLAGTAGESDLSKDAETMLKNPEVYNILPMNWDTLEKHVDPEYITWSRDKFGFFVPAQLSNEAPAKIKTNLTDFTGHEGLEDITFYKTDWGKAKEFFETNRKNKESDIASLSSYTASFPLEVEDCYMTSEVNKFPGLLCYRHKSVIEREGSTGNKVRFMGTPDHLYYEMTNDPIITDYPFKGGNFDAPFVMLEDPRVDGKEPPLGLYCIGLDDIKHDTSDGDSVLSLTVFKRSHEGGEWANRIVGYYDTRPYRKKDAYKIIHLVLKYYNAILLHEDADNGFVEYLESISQVDLHKHISDGVGLAQSFNLNKNKNRKFGWSPTAANIYHLEARIVAYTKEENVVIGAREDYTGEQRINNPMLLYELYKYKKGQNADRIRSFGLALTLAQYLDNTYQYLRSRRSYDNMKDREKKKLLPTIRGLSDTGKLRNFN